MGFNNETTEAGENSGVHHSWVPLLKQVAQNSIEMSFEDLKEGRFYDSY